MFLSFLSSFFWVLLLLPTGAHLNVVSFVFLSILSLSLEGSSLSSLLLYLGLLADLFIILIVLSVSSQTSSFSSFVLILFLAFLLNPAVLVFNSQPSSFLIFFEWQALVFIGIVLCLLVVFFSSPSNYSRSV